NFEPNKPQEVVCGVNGRKNKATFAMDEDESPLHTYSRKVLIESDFSVNRQNTIEGFVLHRLLYVVGRTNLYFEFTVDYEAAKSFRKANGDYLREFQWTDLTVEVYI
ncbi:MAG: hypothetical protein PHR18_07340, partial [Oscillospiraceae bacterium]|nr:hypothetical protein [Oscillospiraceae bacterium]